jgi:hypothetical protein
MIALDRREFLNIVTAAAATVTRGSAAASRAINSPV